MKYLFLKLLPKNLLSRVAGYLADIPFPSPFLLSFIHIYSKIYNVRLHEAKKPLSKMKTFNEFFTRELKDGLRPIDPSPDSITSPVDGTVAEHGIIKHGLLVQTKGILYSLADLVGDRESKLYEDGYFITIYLSPADYHRIHTPIAGEVKQFSYFSGNLWPVNNLGVQQVGGLFALNERLVTPLEGKRGTVGIVKVGATVVGKIKVKFSDVESNLGKKSQLRLPVYPARNFAKGEEIGKFQLGSTVILLFQKDQFVSNDLFREKKVKVGEILGHFKNQAPKESK